MQPPQKSERTAIAYIFNFRLVLDLSIIENNIEMIFLLVLTNKPGVADWRLKPARRGGEQRSANQGKAFPSIYKKDRGILLLRSLMLFDTLVMAMPAQGPA
jgi:hypothetical protein